MQIRNINYTVVFCLCSIFTIIFILGVFFNTIENNAVRLKMNIQKTVFTFVPQGWAFFTRDPREAQIVLYKINNKNKLIQIGQRHSSSTNLFGLNRRADKIMFEFALIKEKLKDSQFQNTRWNYQYKLFSKTPTITYTVKNRLKNPNLKGKYIIIFQKPVPWAWSKRIDKIKMPAKIIRLNIN